MSQPWEETGLTLFLFPYKVTKENPVVSIDCQEVTGDWNNSFHNNHPSTVWISFSMLCFIVNFSFGDFSFLKC